MKIRNFLFAACPFNFSLDSTSVRVVDLLSAFAAPPI
jgi:hypothetical protein